MKNLELLPPIIKDLIESLSKKENPIHVRDNICARLENIVSCSSDAIDTFRNKQTQHYTVKAKRKA